MNNYPFPDFLCYDMFIKVNIRLIYLYLFSFVGLLVVVIGSVRIVDLGLKVFVFKEADKFDYYAPKPLAETTNYDETAARDISLKEQIRNRQRELSTSLALIAVGLPLYLFHWKTLQKENRKA